MNEDGRLLDRFEAERPRLRALAWRLLGTAAAANDALQEARLRLARTAGGRRVRDAARPTGSRTPSEPATGLAPMAGAAPMAGSTPVAWLATIVARVCLDRLRGRSARQSPAQWLLRPAAPATTHPIQDPLTGLPALFDALTPAERVAFVLHESFEVGFDQISDVIGRSPAAARQLIARVGRQMEEAVAAADAERDRQRALIEAFLIASRADDTETLQAVLDADVSLRADRTAVREGAVREVRGNRAVAATFRSRAGAARPALVNGAAGLVWAPGGRPRLVFDFTITRGRIVAIDQIADPDRIRNLHVALGPASQTTTAREGFQQDIVER